MCLYEVCAALQLSNEREKTDAAGFFMSVLHIVRMEQYAETHVCVCVLVSVSVYWKLNALLPLDPSNRPPALSSPC